MDFSPDMQIIELDSFDTAFPVQPGKEKAVKRRFMTLFADGGQAQVGGTSYVMRVQSFTSETFALKRLLASNAIPKDANLTPEDSARITQGHEAAFYEEYKNQLLVSRMRGFPRLYGYASIGGDPAIIMEWVEGVSLRQLLREAKEEGNPLPAITIASIGASVLDVLESAARLDSTLVHRDISPANIIIRTTEASLDEQGRRGPYDVCLIDFGSASADEGSDASFTMVAQVWRNGTPEYAAPEMLTQDIPHIDRLRKSQAIDVFALCSVLYELYCGHTPWRVADHPEVSPYRLKTENPPERLEPRVPEDTPLVDAIESGLAIDQAERPTVNELLAQLRSWLAAQGAPGAYPDDSTAKTPKGPADGSPLADVLPVGLYTPDSTHLKVANIKDGGRRAGEDIPAYDRSQTRVISRRSFIAGGLAVAAIALIGGGIAARSCSQEPEPDFGNYPMTAAIWTGEPLYPAMSYKSSAWLLRSASSGTEVELPTSKREPGHFVDGLIRAFDEASGYYGFCTVEQDADGMKAKWLASLLPRYRNVGDFSAADASSKGALAAIQDRKTQLWGFVDVGGNEVVASAFADVGQFGFGYAPVRQDGASPWNLVDAEGRLAFTPRFQKLGQCSEEGLCAALEEQGGLWGFADTGGNMVIPASFHRVHRFTEGLAACCLDEENGLWGYIQTDGSLAIEAQFASAYPFADGLAPAQDATTKLWGLIDTEGKWIKGHPAFLSVGEKTGELFPAHGSPAYVYDIDDGGADENAWEEYMLNSVDTEICYGYIDSNGTWAINPTYSDTLVRRPAL